MRKAPVITVIIAFLLAATAGAADQRFLTTDPAAIIAMVPPPPANDSPAGMADLETVLQVQKDRTPAQVARAKRVCAHDSLSMGTQVFGPAFNEKNLPRTIAILTKATNERRPVVRASKRQWDRVRPYDRGLGVDPCVERQDNTSYPSGHSSASALWAVFLGKAMPEYEILFMNDVRETMWCRVIGGVHYPSDTQAGKFIGTIIANEMLRNKQTQDAIKEMRAELLDFLKKNPDAKQRAQALLKKTASK
ncbi:phosphatase PAP2 family protein [Ereboglobus luteus]|nr:phosphatase PAP2 family protein [Ereboglobus luteus]